ncbi:MULTISPECIES: flagellar assembly protein A [unclassified Lebetimonas]|uniref:flagellar assembly protein A n=1 Tax=unclassified Lebetimonas TaxID=2648158 RepID=UPI0004655FBD|nr:MULTISPECIES: flagellar assembly protein A [unclassified Lebetimonas]
MGLFDFFKKENVGKKEIQVLPLVVRTENVNDTLAKISSKYNIPLSNLDFEVMEVKTFIKTENDHEFIEIDENSKMLLKNENFLRNEKNEIKQVYEIKIIKYEVSDFELTGKMEINEKFTEAKFILSPKSLIVYSDILLEKFKAELNKKKIKNSLLIDLFDEKMDESVEKIVAKLRIIGSLESEEEILLCKGIDEIPTVQGEVVYHYKKNETAVKKELIYPVKEGEVLIEIKKPKPGKNGRNCRGKIILAEKVKDFEIPSIGYDQKTIKKEEDNEKIVFIALKNGYLYNDSGVFIIKDEMEIKQINIKTGDVTGAKESDIKIDVKESDALKEAIGDNTTVETTTLIVRGNVGNSALIKCKDLKIMGQTHQKSKIYTQKGEINIHKGYVEADEIKITRLENGIVRANKAVISQVVGGEIFAKKVEIEILGSHLKCYALEEIKIHTLKGSENKLIISPAEVLGENIDTDKLQKKLEEIKRDLRINIEVYNKRLRVLKENKSSVDELKKLYLQNKTKGIKTSPAIIKKLKEFNSFKQKTVELKEKIEGLKQEIKEMEETIDKLQNAIIYAKIISLSPWTPYNRIEFDFVEPPIKLTYDTKGNEGVCGFKLKDFGNIKKIVKIKIKENNDSGS